MDSKGYHRSRSVPSASHRRLSLASNDHNLPSSEPSMRQATHPSVNGVFRAHTEVNFKLIKTVSEFTTRLAGVYEQHAEQLLLLVEAFRKRNAELRRDRPPYHSGLFTSWELLLQSVEVDSQIHGDISRSLTRQLGVNLQERTFHCKIQGQKVFDRRESYEGFLHKADELLEKCQRDYNDAYTSLITHKNHTKLAEYYDTHNAYVQQLHAANGMLEHYHRETLPGLLQELEEVYTDVSDHITGSVLCCADLLVSKSKEQVERYGSVVTAAHAVRPRADVAAFVRSLDIDKLSPVQVKHPYNPPYMQKDPAETESGMLLRDELVLDRLSQLTSRPSALKQDAASLDSQIKQLAEAIDSLQRLHKRSLESNLFNKANELQSEICLKKFDLQMAFIHLAGIRAQQELFAHSKSDPMAGNNVTFRKQSTASTGSAAKGKWLKALLNIKSNSLDKADGNKSGKSGSRPLSSAQAEPMSHLFQEHTYKKVAACDHCNEIFKGHTKQGLKCKVCRTNVHNSCADKVGPCNPKPRFLRRQKSTSEIEVGPPPPPADPEASTYRMKYDQTLY